MATSKAEEAGTQEQLPNQSMVSQQYIVTINGDITGQHPPVNIKGIGVTATLQLICAGLSVVLGVIAILAVCIRSFDALSITTGLAFFMVAGIVGRVAVRKKNNCTIIGYMVLSILSALASGSLVISILPVIFYEGPVPYDRGFPPPLDLSRGGRMAINSAIVVVGFLEGIIAIVAAAFCCRGTCCAPPRALQIQYSPAMPAGAGSVVVPPEGQAVTIPHGQTQTIVINPTPASYPLGSLPIQNSAMMTPPTYVVNGSPPAYQANTTPQADNQTMPHGAIGRDATEDDGTDQQALVM